MGRISHQMTKLVDIYTVASHLKAGLQFDQVAAFFPTEFPCSPVSRPLSIMQQKDLKKCTRVNL